MSESKSSRSSSKKLPVVAETVDPALLPPPPVVPAPIPQLVPDHESPSLFYVLQDHLIGLVILLLACVQYLLITLAWLADAIYNFLCKAYRVSCFVYHHPQASKELIKCTYQILRVSYDAGLWSWSDCCDIIGRQLGKMSGPTPVATSQPSPAATEVKTTAPATAKTATGPVKAKY